MASYQWFYINCKECGATITLDVHTGKGVAVRLGDERLSCPVCLKESTYSSDDFKTAKLDHATS